MHTTLEPIITFRNIHLEIHQTPFYIITCTKCNKQYIGETGRKLKIRISEHLQNITKDQNTVISTHFNTASNKSNHMQINAIELLFNSTEYHKVKELFLIKKTANFPISF